MVLARLFVKKMWRDRILVYWSCMFRNTVCREMEVSGASIIQVVEVNGSCHILKVSFVNILLI